MRPKTFDEAAALRLAMVQFWESGYAGSSMQSLVERMGISRQSLYDTFGNKRELFRSALEMYFDEHIRPMIDALERGDRQAPDAVRGYLRSIAEISNDVPAGCLIVRTATEVSPDDQVIGEMLESCLTPLREALARVVARGQQEGQVGSGRSAGHWARSILNFGMGLHVARRLPDRGVDSAASIEAFMDGLRPAA
ncbi:MAG: TetR/AcrR family transcriptional regulator [Wenzhouxiangellaceae bacterium]|nr:TetR/AcrR family transcriptional regulator [Wenzhouxiangellaceae bacterium]